MANGLLSLYCPGRTNLYSSPLSAIHFHLPRGADVSVCRRKKNTGRNVKNSQARKAVSLPEEPRRRRRCCPDRDFKPFGRCRGEGFLRSLSTWRESFVAERNHERWKRTKFGWVIPWRDGFVLWDLKSLGICLCPCESFGVESAQISNKALNGSSGIRILKSSRDIFKSTDS